MTAKEVQGELAVVSSTTSTTHSVANFVVRNDQFSEVYTGNIGTSVSLPPGLYSVETYAASGAPLSQLIRVEAGKRAEVQLTEPAPQSATKPKSRSKSRSKAADIDLSRFEFDPPTSGSSQTSVLLDGGHGWTAATPTPTGWSFEPDDHLKTVPVVRVVHGEHAWDVSLPVNPGSAMAETCTLDRIEPLPEPGVLPVSVGFPPERGVAHFIEGQLKHNTYSPNTDVLDEATTLLNSKYDDPAAAALGGLTLNRFGLLLERASWVENLARDFPWLVDGRILLSALLRDGSDDDRERGLALLLDAARERPLYADGLSLALDLLQRWPDEASSDRRAKGVAELGTLAAYADWSSVSLVTKVS